MRKMRIRQANEEKRRNALAEKVDAADSRACTTSVKGNGKCDDEHASNDDGCGTSRPRQPEDDGRVERDTANHE